MVLLDGYVLTIVLDNNLERQMQLVIDIRLRKQEIARVGQTMPAKRAKIRKFPDRPPNLRDVASSSGAASPERQTEAHATLDNTDLAWL